MNQQMQMVPFTKTVKTLIIANMVLWVGAILVLQGMVLHSDVVFQYFGLIPYRVITDFWLWQPFTYMFLHSQSVFHVIFNMLSLWWFGAELEQRWGARFFTAYYLICGLGAAFIYLVGVLIYYMVSGSIDSMAAPVVGASGCIFGLLTAYGILFGERQILFMMLFPMKAKHFVLIMGAVELFTLMDSGMNRGVANLAHLGGAVSGFVFLTLVARWRARAKMAGLAARGRRLKLVVDNERRRDKKEKDEDRGPRYWN